MERLKAFSVEKFTLDGRKLHTLTILCAKYLVHGHRNRGSRVSGCSPNFWGAGAVLPRKFGDVTD